MIGKSSPLQTLYLHLVKLRKDETQEFRAGNERQASMERLWSEILQNLSKDLEKRRSAPLNFFAGENDFPNETEFLAFSCGHSFGQKQFVNVVLPEFTAVLRGIPYSVPVSLEVLLNEFRCERMNIACPLCAANQLVVHAQRLE